MKIMRWGGILQSLVTGIVITFSGFAVSCSDKRENPFEDAEFTKTPLYEINMTEMQTRAAKTFQEKTGSRVYEILESDFASDNVCFSPLSLQMALSMFSHYCDEGISKDIAKEYLKFLGFSTLEELKNFNSMILKELPKVDGMVKLTLANSIWANSEGRLNFSSTPSWLSDYNVEMFKVPFDDTLTIKRINEWALNKTKNKILLYDDNANIGIKDILLINAFYFLGKWSIPFVENNEKMNFKGIGGQKEVAKLKYNSFGIPNEYNGEKRALTGNSDGRLFAKIPFGNGGYNMYAILPKDGETIEECSRYLSKIEFLPEEQGYISYSGNITIPAFEAKYDVEGLNNALIKIGFPLDFISDEGYTANIDLKQKTVFKMTKDGAEGAGITSVAVSTGMPDMDKVIDVEFNRPFTYYVMEQSTGTLLFIGSVKSFR